MHYIPTQYNVQYTNGENTDLILDTLPDVNTTLTWVNKDGEQINATVVAIVKNVKQINNGISTIETSIHVQLPEPFGYISPSDYFAYRQ